MRSIGSIAAFSGSLGASERSIGVPGGAIGASEWSLDISLRTQVAFGKSIWVSERSIGVSERSIVASERSIGASERSIGASKGLKLNSTKLFNRYLESQRS